MRAPFYLPRGEPQGFPTFICSSAPPELLNEMTGVAVENPLDCDFEPRWKKSTSPSAPNAKDAINASNATTLHPPGDKEEGAIL
jgi:hypothetical protein